MAELKPGDLCVDIDTLEVIDDLDMLEVLKRGNNGTVQCLFGYEFSYGIRYEVIVTFEKELEKIGEL